MDKAGKCLRRSGVRLKNINNGHGDLHMVISDLTEIRSLYKSLISAEGLLWEDLVKWASKEKNGIMQEALVHFSQLHAMWTDVQREFVVNLKKFKHQFELILEGEHHIDKSRNHLKSCEQKEAKIRKEIKQTSSKGTVSSSRALEEKLNESKELVKAAQAEVSAKVDDLEVMKMVMVKDGLTSLSDYYVEMSEKSCTIFEGHKRISEGLPDIKDKELQAVKYTNNEQAKKIVHNTRESLLCYRPSGNKSPSAPFSPPPYSGPENHNPTFPSNPSTSFTSPGSYTFPNQSNIYPPGPALPFGFTGSILPGTPLSQSPPQYTEQAGTHRYDLPPRELYENLDAPFNDMSLDNQRTGWRYGNVQ